MRTERLFSRYVKAPFVWNSYDIIHYEEPYFRQLREEKDLFQTNYKCINAAASLEKAITKIFAS